MKKSVLFFFCFLASSPAFAESAWVQVRQSQLRVQPKFYALSAGSVRYGEKLEKLSEDGGWVKVDANGRQGYLPISAVSADRIVLSAADLKKVQADSSEVVMAGKGFSKEVEQNYRKEDAKLRYDLVDYVERVARVSPGEMARFVQSGGLK